MNTNRSHKLDPCPSFSLAVAALLCEPPPPLPAERVLSKKDKTRSLEKKKCFGVAYPNSHEPMPPPAASRSRFDASIPTEWLTLSKGFV